MQKQIKVLVTQEGQTTITVFGCQGSECIALTENLEKALGKVKQRQETPEYYVEQQVQSELELGGT